MISDLSETQQNDLKTLVSTVILFPCLIHDEKQPSFYMQL